MGARDDRIRRTRAAIADAALALFIEKGYDATTMDDVAERAQVSRSTVFRYFPEKDDLVFAREVDHLGELQQLLRAAPTLDDREVLHGVFVKFGNYLEHDETLLTRIGLIASHPRLRTHLVAVVGAWEELVARDLARGRRPTLHHRVVAATVVGAVQSALREWHDRGGRLSPLIKRALSYTTAAPA